MEAIEESLDPSAVILYTLSRADLSYESRLKLCAMHLRLNRPRPKPGLRIDTRGPLFVRGARAPSLKNFGGPECAFCKTNFTACLCGRFRWVS